MEDDRGTAGHPSVKTTECRQRDGGTEEKVWQGDIWVKCRQSTPTTSNGLGERTPI
jgi:hypothetical protein